MYPYFDKKFTRVSVVLFIVFAEVNARKTAPIVYHDSTSKMPNTLFDDADDIQPQLDNEVRDRLGQIKTAWVYPMSPYKFPGKITIGSHFLPTIPSNKIFKLKRKEKQHKKPPIQHKKDGKSSEPWTFAGQKHWDKMWPSCGGKSQSPVDLHRQLSSRLGWDVQLVFKNYDVMPTNLTMVNNGQTAEHISKLRASQSPIAISLHRCPTWSSLEPLHFQGYWDNEASATLLNTGQTAYFTFEANAQRPRLRGGPLIGEYIFEQMHFHWSVDDFTGCEHVLDGHGYAAECHFVHYNSKYQSLEAAVGHPDGLAVVGFLLEAVDAPNPRFDKLVEGLEGIKKRDHAVHVPSESLSWMERDDLHEGCYVTYKGSLTTPPYTECVTWIIYEKPVQIGIEQVGLLRQLEGPDSAPIDRNVRPTQRHPPGHSVIYVKQVTSKL